MKTEELSEEGTLLRYVIIGAICLCVLGIGSCIGLEWQSKSACIEKGGIPQNVAGNPNWVCMAPPTSKGTN